MVGYAEAEREFFAFDNGLKQLETAKEKAAVLKELGYAGMLSRLGQVEGLPPAFDAVGVKIIGSYVCIGERGYNKAQLAKDIELLKGRGSYIWLFVMGGKELGREHDEFVVEKVREVSDLAKKAGLKVSIYPHTNFYVATALDALRITEKVDRPNVGTSFNLCHFLMQNNVDDLEAVVRKVAPRMNLVSINGADHSSKLPTRQALQRLDKGTFDNVRLLKLLDEVGYNGPVGLQCFNVKGDTRENLRISMDTWKKLNSLNKREEDSK